MEPLAVLGTAYSAYYLAEVFHWSGIISLIGCGITQVQNRVKPDIYVPVKVHKVMHHSLYHISAASHTTIEMFSKSLRTTMIIKLKAHYIKVLHFEHYSLHHISAASNTTMEMFSKSLSYI